MLIITRKQGERLIINDNVVITALDISGSQIKLGIEAPRHVPVHREEVYNRIHSQQTHPEEQKPDSS